MTTTFSQWACDPARTLEERYGAQWLIEHFTGIPVAKDANGQTNYEAARLWRKERSLNPAYEPDYTLAMAQEAEEKLPGRKELDRNGHGDDRPVRDVSFLRFCPGIEKLDVGHTEVRDWSPITACPELKSLWICDSVARDLRPVGELAKLEVARMYLHNPWPELTGWDRLRVLRELHFYGNPLALQAIGALPAVREAEIHQWLGYNVPLRCVGDLPEMPELRRLKLINTWQLEGIERSPLLVNLECYGYFEDLTPLARLPRLTHLTLSGGGYETLAPLAALPELRWLKIRREEPQDYSVLAEMAHLHEVEAELCPASKVELASLNAALTPWGEIFAVEPPRELAPLRLLISKQGDGKVEEPGVEKRDWSENEMMGTSEARWFAREVNRRLNALLGKGWGKCSTRLYGNPGWEHVRITRPEDIDRLREIVETLRELLATARYRWKCGLHVDSLARYERDMDDIADDDDDDEKEETFDAEREREDWEDQQQRARERRAFLERQHRMRLQKEMGAPIRPEDFAPPKPAAEEEELATAGGVADGPPEYDLGTELRLYLTVLERGVFVHADSREDAEMLLVMPADGSGDEEDGEDD